MGRRVASRLVDAASPRHRLPSTRHPPCGESSPHRKDRIVKAQTINANLHDKTHRHRLFTAVVLFLVEIGLIVGVEAAMIHLLITIAVFGDHLAETLLAE